MIDGKRSAAGRKKDSPRALSQEVRQYIIKRAIDERSRLREDLADSIINELELKGYIAPSLETTMRYISNARSHTASELDKPWTIGSEIQPDAIPYLIGYQRVSNRPLSIRKASWMARLLPMVKELITPLTNNTKLHYGYLSRIADFYVERQIMSEIIDKPVNTADLDDYIFITKHDSIESLDKALLEWLNKCLEIIENIDKKEGAK